MACDLCLPLPVRGIFLMVCSGTLLNVLLGMCQHMATVGWPDLLIMAGNNALVALLALVWLLVHRPAVPETSEIKWVFMAGFAFTASYMSMLLAVRVGMSLGDFASLNSTNVVFAALLGRLFLSEPLGAPHVAAVLSSVVGATLISQPEALFGNSSGPAAPWFAYLFALLSGLGDAGVFVCSRRLSDMSPAYLLLSFNAQSAVASFACAATMEGGLAVHLLAAAPREAIGLVLGSASVHVICMVVWVLAAQWCPAAVSATTDTGTRMIVGYGAQLLLGAAPLDGLTLVGAALMLCGVVAMALARTPESDDTPERGDCQPPAVVDAPAGCVVSEIDDGSDTNSLVSFIASEFTDVAPQPWGSSHLRQRRSGADEPDQPLPKLLGATSTTLAAVMPTASV